MKCYKLKSTEYTLPLSLFKRVGAVNATSAYPEHCHVSRPTLIKIYKAVRANFSIKYVDVIACEKAITAYMASYQPQTCVGLPEGFMVVDRQAIITAIMEEEMISELARDKGDDSSFGPGGNHA